MEKKKLITALMICCMAVLPAVATTYTNVQDITTGVSNDSGTNGGAVYNTLTGATISGTSETDKIEFGNNTAVNGGAVYNDGSSASITITNTTFSKNTSTNQTGGGGAIYNSAGTINVGDNVSFIDNYINNDYNPDGSGSNSYTSAGGAISSWGSGTVNITGENVRFEENGLNSETGNPSWSYGGALYIDTAGDKQAVLNIGKGTVFENNQSAVGGAIYMGGTDAEITGAQFTGNKTDYGSGGTIYVYGGPVAGATETTKSDITITDTTFEDNYSGYSGGAISNRIYGNYDDSKITITGSTFEGNYANAQDDYAGGGAIENRGTIVVSGSEFNDNSAAKEGGAIINWGATEITGSTFDGNEAESGGAIYNYTQNLTIQDTTFTNNTATKNGGALYNASGAVAALTDVTVNEGTGAGQNSIYNAGTINTAIIDGVNTFNSDIISENGTLNLGGTNNVGGDISGTGTVANNGTSVFAGDNSGFIGTFTQDSSTAETTVTGTFFGGTSTIEGGILNWETTEEISENGSLDITGGNLNIGGSGTGANTGILTVGSNVTIENTVITTINEGSSLNISGGSVTLDNSDIWNGNVILTDGTLGLSNINQIGSLSAESGNLLLTNSDIIINENETLESEVAINIDTDSSLTVNGGSAFLDGADTWNGNVTLTDGSLVLNNVTQNGNFSAADGNLTLVGTDLSINTGHTIAESVTTIIDEDSTLTVNIGGSTVLDSTDTWNGEVSLNGGDLTLKGVNQNGNIEAVSGNLELTSGSLTIGEGSSIAEAVSTNLTENTKLNITENGSVSIDNNDTWDGAISMNGGSLSLTEVTTGILNATAGEIIMDNVTLGAGTVIEGDVEVTSTDGYINIGQDMEFTYDNNDNLAGEIQLNGGILNYSADENHSTNLSATSGNLNLLNSSYLVVTSPSNIEDLVVVNIQSGSTLEVDNGATFNLNGVTGSPEQSDQWNGMIVNDGGTINASNISNSATSGLTQQNGTTNISDNSNITLGDTTSAVTGGTINVTNNSILTAVDASIIQGGDINIDSTSTFTSNGGGFIANNLAGSGVFAVQNGSIDQHEASILSVGDATDSQLDFTFDVYGRSNSNKGSDKFVFDTIKDATGNGSTINISDWGLGGDIYGWDAPIDRHIDLGNIFAYNTLEGNVEFNSTKKEIHTPIGYYQLNNHGGLNGNYTLDLARYDGKVFRGQVSTVAQWMNQLAIDDMLFTHSMVLPSFKEEDGGTAPSGMMANRYAATSPMFAPYQYSRKDGGLWYKMYGNFENLQMNNGLKVGNNSYGALIGADFGLKELKHGWKFMPTAYIGYNGAHQTFANMGAYQNGGQAGFLGTFYKNNFIVAGLVYGGVYDNSMDVAGHTENTFNYFAGAATKAAYNIRLHRDWVLQPNIMAAYNFFGQQNWHSDYGQMGMMAGMLHGVNIAPGVNLIWEKDTFSAYITLQYMYNVNGAVGGRAGNVDLPHMEMERGYIQYGIGFTKKFTDRASGYLQAVLRNVGRTGAGFQLGFNYFLGK